MNSFQNTGGVDRVIRFVIAIVAAIAAYYTHGWVRIVWIVITVIMLLSGSTGFTLPYKLFGINTKKK
jgi:hypothetical protein